MLIVFSRLSSSDGTSEEILVLLLREVDVIVSVRVGEFSGVVSVILPGRLRSESLSVGPGLQFQVRDGSVLVVITKQLIVLVHRCKLAESICRDMHNIMGVPLICASFLI